MINNKQLKIIVIISGFLGGSIYLFNIIKTKNNSECDKTYNNSYDNKIDEYNIIKKIINNFNY